MFIHVNHICAKNGSGTGTFLEFPEVLLTTAMILFNAECKVYVLLLFRHLGGITHLRKVPGHLKATAGKYISKREPSEKSTGLHALVHYRVYQILLFLAFFQ